jgi:hypothetical protein
MSQKYRQQGYQDFDRKVSEPRRSPRNSASREGPRSPRMPGMRKVVKCANCGTAVSPKLGEITPAVQCPKCSADLHSCKNCAYFDPGARFECSQPITQRVSPKDKSADCELFEIRSSVEKITTSSQAKVDPTDARDAFENLFKDV